MSRICKRNEDYLYVFLFDHTYFGNNFHSLGCLEREQLQYRALPAVSIALVGVGWRVGNFVPNFEAVRRVGKWWVDWVLIFDC